MMTLTLIALQANVLICQNEALNDLKAVVSGGIRQSNPAFAKATAGSPAINPRDKSAGIMATVNKKSITFIFIEFAY